MEGENNTTKNQNATLQTNPSVVATDNSMLMGVLAYISILILVPFLMAKENAFVKFHIKQGLVLVVIGLVSYVVNIMMPALFPLVALINLATLILSIIGIVNVIQKKEVELPLVGQFAKNFTI